MLQICSQRLLYLNYGIVFTPMRKNISWHIKRTMTLTSLCSHCTCWSLSNFSCCLWPFFCALFIWIALVAVKEVPSDETKIEINIIVSYWLWPTRLRVILLRSVKLRYVLLMLMVLIWFTVFHKISQRFPEWLNLTEDLKSIFQKTMEIANAAQKEMNSAEFDYIPAELVQTCWETIIDALTKFCTKI